jgi:hypothetical protein
MFLKEIEAISLVIGNPVPKTRPANCGSAFPDFLPVEMVIFFVGIRSCPFRYYEIGIPTGSKSPFRNYEIGVPTEAFTDRLRLGIPIASISQSRFPSRRNGDFHPSESVAS